MIECVVCHRISYCPCKACTERNPDNLPRYKKEYSECGNTGWETCPHCNYKFNMDWEEDYQYRSVGYYNGTGKIGDMNLEKARENMTATRDALLKKIQWMDEQLSGGLEIEFEKWKKWKN